LTLAMRRIAPAAEDTEAFGAELARTCPCSARLLVVELTGDLGAGKTTLVRGFLRECGVHAPVRSPTYTLVETYALGSRTFVHLDLYRLTDSSELENLGLRDLAGDGHTWLVEWPERAAGRLPPADLAVRLSAQARSHCIEVEARSVAGSSWLGALQGS
jgi:tRNA threonylcarbamoyladenosine biosynthesis protein TsaE